MDGPLPECCLRSSVAVPMHIPGRTVVTWQPELDFYSPRNQHSISLGLSTVLRLLCLVPLDVSIRAEDSSEIPPLIFLEYLAGFDYQSDAAEPHCILGIIVSDVKQLVLHCLLKKMCFVSFWESSPSTKKKILNTHTNLLAGIIICNLNDFGISQSIHGISEPVFVCL